MLYVFGFGDENNKYCLAIVNNPNAFNEYATDNKLGDFNIICPQKTEDIEPEPPEKNETEPGEQGTESSKNETKSDNTTKTDEASFLKFGIVFLFSVFFFL